MLNATVPILPNQSVDLIQRKPGLEKSDPLLLDPTWYLYFNSERSVLLALLAAPMQVQQSGLAALAAKLDTSDTGLQVWVPVYNHILRWDGKKWTFGPGDLGSGFVVSAQFPLKLNADGWVECKGQNVSYLNPDGTIGNVVVQNTNAYFRI